MILDTDAVWKPLMYDIRQVISDFGSRSSRFQTTIVHVRDSTLVGPAA